EGCLPASWANLKKLFPGFFQKLRVLGDPLNKKKGSREKTEEKLNVR
ncbi:hypothetical protein RUMTOR_02919, partial [[Ruminococcus] torques ATCC 27756]